MASLKEIAERVGVTHTLVSRVLNNKMGTARVSEKKREEIFRVAKQMNYEPSFTAKALRKGLQGSIGVFIHGVGGPGSNLNLDFISAASRRLTETGNHCWLKFFDDKQEFIEACQQNLLGRIDGLIIAGIAMDVMENLDHLERSKLPVTFACHGPINEDEFLNFQVDAEAQGYLAAKHLIEQGCRRIAHFFTLPPRYRGYLRAHEEAGIKVDDRLTAATRGYSASSGAVGMKLIWASKLAVDGICAQSDGQALGAYQFLTETGVPREQWPLIVGVDDSPIATDLGPIPITSVTSEMKLCAELAVDAVVKRINGESARGQTVAPRIVVRESTRIQK